MYLKSIELAGFKSFPDRVTVDFNSGITAIVGPNGSGKSNIADAIRWVLGEQSAKALRGSKMEDIIFGGTANRHALGFAEVSLTIDNTDHRLPIDYSEVTITRRYYRSGESEYYINRSLTKLRTINELFMDTGLGRDGYSVIGQGRIADVLSLKKEARRQIFEEAAGISKYRYHKEESQRKLHLAEENLVRIEDIKAELDERLPALQKQAEDARRYMQLYDQRKVLEISVWVSQIERIGQASEQLRADIYQCREHYERIVARISALERAADEGFEAVQEKGVQIEKQRARADELERQSSEIDRQAAEFATEIAHNQSEAQTLERMLGEIEKRKEDISAQIDGKMTQIAEKRARLNKAKQGFNALSGELAGVVSGMDRFGADMSEARAALAQIMQRTTENLLEVSSCKSALSALKEQLTAAKEQSEQRETRWAQAEKARAALQREQKQTLETLARHENILSGIRKKLDLRKQAEQKQRALVEQDSGELYRIRQRYETLKDLEKHYDGFARSVKSVMGYAERGQLKHIRGPVARLIRVEKEYTVAVETALGPAAQHIIVDSEEDARNAIYLLKRQNAGRATFLPLSAMKGSPLRERLAGTPGFISLASQAVQCEDKYRAIIDYLLGRVVIMADMDAAIKLARTYANRFRIVTLDGQVIHAGGSMTGGSVNRSAGSISRQAEIEQLKSAGQKQAAALEQKQKSLAALSEETGKLAASLEGALAEYQTLKEGLVHTEARLSQSETFAAQLAQERARQQALFENLQEKEKADVSVLAQLEEKKKALEAEREKAQAKISELEGSGSQLDERREALREQVNDAQLALVSIQNEIGSLEQAVAMLQTQRDQQQDQRQDFHSRIAQMNAENEILREKAAALQAQAAARRQQAEQARAAVSEILAARETLEKQINEHTRSARELAGEKERLASQAAKLEAKAQTLADQSAGFITKLWDEYELPLSDAKQLASPIEDLGKAEREARALRGQMRTLGDVNIGAIDEYAAVSERHAFLSAQIADIETSKKELGKVIDELTAHMEKTFATQIVRISAAFGEVFADLFGGGSARLVVEDKEDILNSAIEIEVKPPGKAITNISLFSGGEQAFIAIALYFAMLRINPTAFCILDEIDAPLDEVNVFKFASYLRGICKNTQFIAITHRRGTMELADMLYGVTMQEKGVSKLLAINVAEAEKQIGRLN